MVTIKDVAKKAKVSISTVSRVLNNSGYVGEETRKNVQKAMEELRFQKNMIAAAMIMKQTLTFGLIIPDIKNVFYADLTRGVEDMANKNNYNVILCNTDNNLMKEEVYINFLLQKGIDGIIFSTPEVRDSNVNKLLELRPNFPVITLGSKVEGSQVTEVLVDNFDGGYIATKHLLQLGHKRIGFIAGRSESYATIERQKGYVDALKEYGIPIDKEIIYHDEFKIEQGYKHALLMLKKDSSITAIFAGNDAIAVGVYQAAHELGLSIPDDLSVIGFDDSEYSKIIFPQLTTIHSPTYEIGARGMELAIKNIVEKSTTIETVVFRPKLVIRNSTSQVGRKEV